MLEPLVDEYVGRVVIERFADEFAHGDARGLYWGVKTIFFDGHCRGMGLCRKDAGGERRPNPTRKSPDLNARPVPDKINIAAPHLSVQFSTTALTETRKRNPEVYST